VFAPPRINLTGTTMSAAKAERKTAPKIVPKTAPTWGYHATEPARIFDIPERGHLPAGWHDHPDKAKARHKGRHAEDKR
jgi:hypothetical protein